jgi:hypothetical protein
MDQKIEASETDKSKMMFWLFLDEQKFERALAIRAFLNKSQLGAIKSIRPPF